jgi:iron complex outermembrane receptor protein
MQLAGRTDRYSDYGRSTIPKIGLAWAVNPSLKLRGTYAKGFRAPSLTEITKSSVSAFTYVTDPIKCVNGDENQCFQPIGLLIQANPNIQPETAKSSTAVLCLISARKYRYRLITISSTAGTRSTS